MRILFCITFLLSVGAYGCKSSDSKGSIPSPRTTPKTQYGAAINQAEGLNRANDDHNKALEESATDSAEE